MNKLYDFLKCMIYASFYVIVIKTSMDFYEYKRFPSKRTIASTLSAKSRFRGFS
jgi:hypothetical protein